MKEYRFDPARERIPIPEPLSNTEADLLRDLLRPGLPLWKILRELDDYREGLKESLINTDADIDDPQARMAWKKTQFTAAAIQQLFESIEVKLNQGEEDVRA